MSGSPATWRERWAYQENARRAGAYAEAIDRWQRREDRLRAMRDLAATFAGGPGDPGTPVPLRAGEQVYATLSGVWYVEAPHTDWLPPPAWDAVEADTPAGTAPPDIRVGHRGAAVVTNRRLIFRWAGQDREWAYEDITGLSHDPLVPMTLIRVAGRRDASGLLADPAVAGRLRFHLQLALADAAGARAALVTAIDDMRREHHQRRPAQPLAVEPIDAPLRARWSTARRWSS